MTKRPSFSVFRSFGHKKLAIFFNDKQLFFSTHLTERSVNIEFPLLNYKGANANKAIDIDDLFQTARKSLTYNFEIHVRI